MSKTFALVTLFALSLSLVGGAFAMVGSPDTECRAHGFDYGIYKNEGCGVDWSGSVNGYDLGLDFDGCQFVDWEANPAVDGVLTKEGVNTWVHPGGTSGTIESTPYVDDMGMTKTHDISHVTFCGYEEEIPEFGGIAALAVVGLVGAALVVLKRR